MRLITRAGNDFSSHFQFIATAVSKLPVQSCLIDGERAVIALRLVLQLGAVLAAMTREAE